MIYSILYRIRQNNCYVITHKICILFRKTYLIIKISGLKKRLVVWLISFAFVSPPGSSPCETSRDRLLSRGRPASLCCCSECAYKRRDARGGVAARSRQHHAKNKPRGARFTDTETSEPCEPEQTPERFHITSARDLVGSCFPGARGFPICIRMCASRCGFGGTSGALFLSSRSICL